MNIHESAEDYLEAILRLKEAKGYARSVDISLLLGVTKPSVSVAMKRLRENGYLTMDADNLITLTPAGMEIARSIYDRHKTLSSFLESLGVDSDVAREDACKIEHDISEESFTAIRKLMQEREQHPEIRRSNGISKQSRVESPLFRRIRPGFSIFLTSPFPVSGMSVPARPPKELPSAHRRQAWNRSPRPAGKLRQEQHQPHAEHNLPCHRQSVEAAAFPSDCRKMNVPLLMHASTIMLRYTRKQRRAKSV